MDPLDAVMEQAVLFGIPFSQVTLAELCSAVLARVRSGEPGFIVTPNVDHVCRFHRDPEFRAHYERAFLVVPDGVPLLWSARLLGRPLRQKLSGSDLVPALCRFAAAEGLSVFFLGGRPGAAERSAERLATLYPDLNIAGTLSPPMGFEETENNSVLETLRTAQPDLCFVALGSPKQEAWMDRNLPNSGVKVMIGVGAGLDFASGLVKRAPRLVQRSGFEWLWRLAHEPRRLWRRYLVYDLFFFVLVWRELRGTAA
jgi:N-acetylglucosaminyldiphosphoundecaprenol N-acetyl-beta-D-mannosaminyltransferase